MFTLRFLSLWQPALVSCLLRQWESQQVFWRSQCFYAGRVLGSPAPLQDKLRRLGYRHGADQLTLLYDCGEAQFAFGTVWSEALGQERHGWPWGRVLEGFHGRLRTVWLRALVDTGRTMLVAPSGPA